jgi:hypothetical protein
VGQLKVSATIRLFLFVSGCILWLGIALSGFDAVHWLLHVPAAAFILAALTSLCPGLIFSRMLFRSRE